MRNVLLQKVMTVCSIALFLDQLHNSTTQNRFKTITTKFTQKYIHT